MGAPVHAVQRFDAWVQVLPDSVELGAELVTHASWSMFRRQAMDSTLSEYWSQVHQISRLVRYPADDIAYVVAPATPHSEGAGLRLIDDVALASTDGVIITLVREENQWRVHAVGQAVWPTNLGKQPYS